ncbi:hypothetical protein KA082_01780, partial [Candidatus Woesebacteria bacterium]|nr:hypothetical protein [Candidatus Woesebacteria bacterium]
YYFLIAALLLGKTVTTLYSRSVVVQHGLALRQEQIKQKQLAAQKAALISSVAQAQSIALVKNSPELVSYKPISTVLVVASTQNLASVQ